MPTLESLFDGVAPWKGWRNLSDRELLGLELIAENPEDLPGLMLEVRPGEMPVPEFDYDMSGREVLTRCAFCRRRNHHKGFVARYPDGARVLAGRICAQEHLGATFKGTLKDFDAALERRRLVLRQKAVARHCGCLNAHMKALIRHPAVLAYDAARKAMRDVVGPLWTDLSSAAARGDELTVDRRVVDTEAIERMADAAGFFLAKQRRSFLRAQAQREGAMKTVTYRLGRIDGASFHRNGLAVATVLTDLGHRLRAAGALICGSDVPSRDIVGAFTELAEVRNSLMAAFERLGEARAALSQDNLERIATWLNDRARWRWASGLDDIAACHEFQVRDGGFFERRDSRYRASLPEVYHVPAPKILDALSEALAETGH